MSKNLLSETLRNSSLAFAFRALRNYKYYKKIETTKKYADSQLLLQRYKGIHNGERCFIVATGPSLTLDDVEKIKDEYTFGVNSCYRLFDKTNWRPSYYCVSDINVYREIKDQLIEMPLKHVFFEGSSMDYNGENGIPFYQLMVYEFCSIAIKNKRNLRKFSLDASKVIYGGASVVYIALQIAVMMGFSEIYLLGVDCNYSGRRKHSALVEYNKQPKLAPGAETNMIQCFATAKCYAEKAGIKIYNATRGGRLEVFERVNLDCL